MFSSILVLSSFKPLTSAISNSFSICFCLASLSNLYFKTGSSVARAFSVSSFSIAFKPKTRSDLIKISSPKLASIRFAVFPFSVASNFNDASWIPTSRNDISLNPRSSRIFSFCFSASNESRSKLSMFTFNSAFFLMT